MELRNSITLKERIEFVNHVKELCMANADVNYAVFDYAFRFCVYNYFVVGGANMDEMEEIDICNLIYSPEFNEALIMNHASVPAINSLHDACEKELEREDKKFMVNYTAVYNPNPLDRIADVVEELKDKVEPLLSEENVIKLLKQMYKDREEQTAKAKKAMRRKPPVKLAQK